MPGEQDDELRPNPPPVETLPAEQIPGPGGVFGRGLGTFGELGRGQHQQQLGLLRSGQRAQHDAAAREIDRLGDEPGGQQHLAPVPDQPRMVLAEGGELLGGLVVEQEGAREVSAAPGDDRAVVHRHDGLGGLTLLDEDVPGLLHGPCGQVGLSERESAESHEVQRPRFPDPVAGGAEPRKGPLQVDESLAGLHQGEVQRVGPPRQDPGRHRGVLGGVQRPWSSTRPRRVRPAMTSVTP